MAPSALQTRTFLNPRSSSFIMHVARPRRIQSTAKKSTSGRAAASSTTASPLPQPISRTRGASRLNAALSSSRSVWLNASPKSGHKALSARFCAGEIAFCLALYHAGRTDGLRYLLLLDGIVFSGGRTRARELLCLLRSTLHENESRRPCLVNLKRRDAVSTHAETRWAFHRKIGQQIQERTEDPLVSHRGCLHAWGKKGFTCEQQVSNSRGFD